MTQLNFGRDVQGFNAFAPYLSKNMYSATVESATAEGTIVPSSNKKWIAVFSYQVGSDFWVSINNTAAAPVGATFAVTTSFLLPAQLQVNAGDTISIYNNTLTNQGVGIALYAVS